MSSFFPPRSGGPSTASYNVRSYGAAGNGTTDDTAAIQRAINAAYTAKTDSIWYSVYFPAGQYKVTSTLTIPGTGCFWGEGNASMIAGAVANNYVFKFTGGSESGILEFVGLTIQNLSTGGSCIGIYQTLGMFSMHDCTIQPTAYGFVSDSNLPGSLGDVFSVNVSGCKFLNPQGSFGSSVGMGWVGSGGSVTGCDFQGLNIGLQMSGTGMKVSGCRAESNNIAVQTGTSPSGVNKTLACSSFDTFEFEANGIAFDGGMNHGEITRVSVAGEQQGGLGGVDSLVGVQGTYTECQFEEVLATGDFKTVAWLVQGQNLTFVNCAAQNTINTNKPSWVIDADPSTLNFIGLGPSFNGKDSGTQPPFNWQGNPTRSLGKFDMLNGMVSSRNLSSIAVIVAASDTSAVITFPPSYTGNQAETSSLVAGTGGSPGLANGTYYYDSTIVTELGETGASNPGTHSVVLSGANNKVTVTAFGVAGSGYKRRFYRGTSPGVYDGYLESALNTNTIVDQGQALTGLGIPGAQSSSPSSTETDTNYSVLVSFEWDAGSWWIDNKTTTGFTIHWKTAPGTSANLNWLLHR